MVDILSTEQRSALMGRIRGINTKPEVMLRKALHKLGLRFRLHYSLLPGKPDIVLPKYRTVIFVHGCFWHRHEKCKRAFTPTSNISFWKEKFQKTVARDVKVIMEIQSKGWRVFVIWECELDSAEKAEEVAVRIRKILLGTS
jgi:DNA mismatch endonuclease, patch repair protein